MGVRRALLRAARRASQLRAQQPGQFRRRTCARRCWSSTASAISASRTASRSALFNALQRRNIPSRLVVFPDENHWILKPQNSIQWYREVHGWLDRWLRQGWPRCRSQRPSESAAHERTAKTFDPAEIEARWYARWEERGAVPPGRGPRPSRSRS